jgi:hypothetical protein
MLDLFFDISFDYLFYLKYKKLNIILIFFFIFLKYFKQYE